MIGRAGWGRGGRGELRWWRRVWVWRRQDLAGHHYFLSSDAWSGAGTMLSGALVGLLLRLCVPSQLWGTKSRIWSGIAFGWERQSLQLPLNKLELCRILDDGFLEPDGFSSRHALAFLQGVVGKAYVFAQLDRIRGVGRARCGVGEVAVGG